MSVLIKGLTIPNQIYRKAKCPKRCYRAQLTQELRERPDLFFLPISWANFKGTKECPMDKEVPDNGNNL